MLNNPVNLSLKPIGTKCSQDLIGKIGFHPVGNNSWELQLHETPGLVKNYIASTQVTGKIS